MSRPSRITVLFNTDYDAEACATDVISVETSARAVATALTESGFEVELIGLHGLEVLAVIDQVRAAAPDLVFNLCESMAGNPCNEPTFVGLLDLFGIPYTGADLLALASCLHKQRAKDILIARGIPTPPHRFLTDAAALDDPALDALDYPWFVKLAHEDASVGITEANWVATPAALRQRARELNVTLIGNAPDLQVLPLHEIDFSAMPADRPRIVSYAAKWNEDHVDYAGTKPVLLRDASPALTAAVEQVARAAWEALGLRDYGRIDLRVDAAGPWVIDVNPNPDISPDAGVARSAQIAGLSYPQLISRLAEVAYRRIRPAH
ncbi:MAG: D-alanine--D-alanine ligase [Deltaproteobacteria bacterium]|nr:MAG: D-alanine--D-alanine ligase [Deltaproteobacteria bacterium]